MTIDYPWYAVLLCLLVGAIYAAVMYFLRRDAFPAKLRWLLTALRFLAVSAIALLLLAPLRRHTVVERQLPHVVMLCDRSSSVSESADSAFSLAPLVGEVESRCRVSMADFGGASTDIGGALQAVASPDVAAVVLASDGINNRGVSPSAVAERLPYPVFTVGLGDTTRLRDAAVGNLRASRVATLGSGFEIELTVTAQKLKNRSASLRVINGENKTLAKEQITYSDDLFAQTVSLNIPAETPGMQRFSVDLSTVDGEAISVNNTITFYVDVIDIRHKVAIVAAAPHPDIAALRHAIDANPNYESTVFYADDLRRHKTDGLNDCSVAIVHNLPSKDYPDIGIVGNLPRIFIIGMQTDLSRFNSLNTGLSITARASHANEVTAIFHPEFSLFNLEQSQAEAIEAMPPLSAPFGEVRAATTLQTLFSARLGNIDTRLPLVVATAQSEPRQVFIWGEGLWRWRLSDWHSNETHDHFDNLISQLVNFAATNSNVGRFRVQSDHRYISDEQPDIRAFLYNESMQPTNAPDATLHLVSDSLDADYTFTRDGQAYRLKLPSLKPGVYHYHAMCDGLTDDGSFVVEDLGLEQRESTANHSLLRSISQLSNGSFFTKDRVGELADTLSMLKPTIYSHTSHAEVLRMPIVLALIILLLAAEWVLRKYHGEL